MAGRVPPRYVPTLTQVVAPAATPGPEPVRPALGGPAQEQLVERLMRRVDLTLEGRLREVIAAAVIEQTRALAPVLREEIEAAVRQAVADAFRDELPGDRGPAA